MQTVKDFYLAREIKKPGFTQAADHVRENLYVIGCCDVWDLNQKLTEKDIANLVIVMCDESRELIRNGRLLKDVAIEADRQMRGIWKSGFSKQWIEDLLTGLEKDPASMSSDAILLREKVRGEPDDGSFYVQDGNHRLIAASIYWMRYGRMPYLTFFIGRFVDQHKFFKKR